MQIRHILKDEEIRRLKNADPDSLQAKLYRAYRARILDATRFPEIRQPGDGKEWFHICQPRCEGAAFLWLMERNEHLGQWIHDAAMWMADQDASEWIGPWFRNHSKPYVGMLETAHITSAVCAALDMAEDRFTEEEKEILVTALREKGMIPCRRYCDSVIAGKRSFNNFFHVIFGGYAHAALMLQDREATKYVLTYVQRCADMYGGDSYGETLHYSDYASTNYCWLNEYLLRLLPGHEEKADIACYGRLMKWYAASFIRMKPYFDDGIPYPRNIDFGDSGSVFRAEGDLLAQISSRLKEIMPQEAALASWLLRKTYASSCTEDMSVLRKIDSHCGNIGYLGILMLPNMAEAKSPEQLGMDLNQFFGNGDVILRDRWEDPGAVLAIKGGYSAQRVTNHRHQDLGSFIWMQGTERMVIDGGTCCYRLKQKIFCSSSLNHSVIDFVGDREDAAWGKPTNPYEGTVQQYLADGNWLNPKPSRAVNIRNEVHGSAGILSVDLSLAYGEGFGTVRRAFVTAFPGALFLIDQAETNEEIRMRAHFPINNRDGTLRAIREDNYHYTFIRGQEAVKIAECACFTDGKETPSALEFDWGYCNSNQQLLAMQEGQGAEGSAEIYNWLDPEKARKHLRICAVMGDKAERIDQWRAERNADGTIVIRSPENGNVLVLRLDTEKEEAVLLQDGKELPLF